MSDLTEKWKNGELEKGYYYTQYTPKIGKPFIEIELRNYLLDLAKVRDADTVKILAPVPSYAEYMILVSYKEELTKACKMRDKIIKKYEDIDDWRKAENQKLKELLKECREWIEYLEELMLETENIDGADYFQRLLTKIDEVLK